MTEAGRPGPDHRASSGLGSLVRRGAMWSTLSQLTLRAGSVVLGIVLARLLAPEQFGVYAVALTVQAILANLSDLGLSADLIRCDDPERRAPVVAVVGLVASTALAVAMVLSSHALAAAFGTPDAAPVIALLAPTLILSGISVVPYAMLCRAFDQRRLFLVALTDFVLSAVITVALVEAGVGVLSLAIGRLGSQVVTTALQFVLAGVRPRYRAERGVAVHVLRFGIPVAGANSLSWLVLNLDNMIIARVVGPVALGFYVLAFNISNWPMSVIGQVTRAVALPAFARTAHGEKDTNMAFAAALSGSLALAAGTGLALLAGPVVHVLYGGKWAAATPVLAALGLFGAVRVLFDLSASYLMARGRSGLTLAVQVWWLVTLVPAIWLGATRRGIEGAAWAHVVVAILLILPAYIVAVGRAGADLRALGRSLLVATGLVLPTVPAMWLLARLVEGDLARLLVAGGVGAGLFLACFGLWLRRGGRREQEIAAPVAVGAP